MKKNNCVKKGTHPGADPGFPKRGSTMKGSVMTEWGEVVVVGLH